MTDILPFLVLAILMVLNAPVAYCLAIGALVFFMGSAGVPVQTYVQRLVSATESFPLLAIPFFILAGVVMNEAGITGRIMKLADTMVGHMIGGLARVNVLLSTLMGGMSGSANADAAMQSTVLVPEMTARGYDKAFSAAVTAFSSIITAIIPPSIVMVMYSVATSGMVVTGPDGEPVLSASIGTMFMAGVIPGLMLATMLGATTYWRARKNNYPRMERAGWAERWTAFRESIWGLMLIVIIMGGIYGGIFTPTEAAAVSAVYAFVIAVWVYKDIKLRDVPKVLLSSAAMSAMLLYIITNAVMFAFILTSEQIPQTLSDWIVGLGLGKIGFLLVVNVMLLFIGMVMEPSAIVLIMAPILYPVAVKLGVDPVHFGIMMVVNMEIGLCTPPVGLNLYVGSAISKLGLTEVTKAALPWLATALVFLMLVTYIPDITMFLPRLLGMH